MDNTWLITGCRVVDPSTGRYEVSDLFVKDGNIAPLPSATPAGIPRIDASGLIAVPGFIDIHVHFREPGNTDSETVDSGSLAAAAGGFAAVVTMPNTTPPIDNAEAVSAIARAGTARDRVRILPAGCITMGRRGIEPADLEAMAHAGAVAFTDDGSTVADDDIMLRAMRTAARLGVPIMDHAIDPVLAGNGVMHLGAQSRAAGLPGIPAEAETRIVERDIMLAERTGCAAHIQHVSCAQSVSLIRSARNRGIRVSAEVTPHHLTLCDADVNPDRPDRKMAPPLRSADDRNALCAAVAEGIVETLATDHAPHAGAARDTGFIEAPFGVIGLETAIGVTYTALVETKLMNLIEWVRRWTTGPAGVIGLKQPSLDHGEPATLSLLDLDTPYTVDSHSFMSKSRNTAFEGRKLTGRSLYTFRGGVMLWPRNCAHPS